jgi:hypothetical protein
LLLSISTVIALLPFSLFRLSLSIFSCGYCQFGEKE